MKQRRQLLLAGAGWLAAPVFAQGLSPEVSPAALERLAPALPALGVPIRLPELSLLDGTVFKPEQAKGQVTVVYWWASTCPFCAQQSPEMQKLWLANQAKGLRMLALSVDKTPEAALAYLHKKGYSFPSGWVTPQVQQVLPKPKGLPVTLVIGRDGKLLQAEKGQMFPEDVAQLASWL
jgi:peroxiredoxin